MPTVKQVIDIINQIAPFSLAESWDNSGLQAGDPGWPVSKILIALDVTDKALAEAETLGCDMLITHHPLIMSPEKKIDFSKMPGAAILISAGSRIAVVSAHTNLDKARDGLNDYLAQKLGIVCTNVFIADAMQNESVDQMLGIGRIGRLDGAMTLEQLACRIKEKLGVPRVRIIGNPGNMVSTTALCSGSGGSLTTQFLASGMDVYITGDLKYHEARDIEGHAKSAVDVGHFGSESIAVELLKKRLGRIFEAEKYEIVIHTYDQEQDPFLTI
ncbi:Nif3-like dinuclear metal center hexameric protein [Desulfobacter latus]|uniref:GTP cyclohydrolase 1 type 2 homolog n=1 Tax=Desulfobacter latus TaxID=2292 RepID=A0A850TBT0_9BACT|nr:Nif3-like dinuclear metal center hexameric protein [Desulfobacter latus]NWH04826.1 Nif3-like dinuclear metal center hexameric protein [Desulfobacter latus]